MLLLLRGSVKPYSWGSRTAMPGLFGWSPTAEPMAELWLGSHPAGPATTEVDGRAVPLDVLITEQPGLCGQPGGLPFLLKVLAAERALSLQVHPNAVQAAAGFEEEERRGVPVNAPHRCYRDRGSKAEMVVALSAFRALAGVREPTESLRVVRALDAALPREPSSSRADGGALLRAFAPLVADPSTAGVTATLRGLLTMSQGRAAVLVAAVVAAARTLTGSGDPTVARYADLATVLAGHHPGDVGVVVGVLLHDITLEPGEALYLPVRSLHSYISGLGVELMVSSDNVLRGGLTDKHVDVDALLTVLDATPAAPVMPDLSAVPIASWGPDGGGFVLHRVRPDPRPGSAPLTPIVYGPAVLLAVDGRLRVETADSTTDLAPGQAVLVPAPQRFTVSGSGTGYLATCP